MPRKLIATPKADSVGSLLSPSRDPFQADRWKAEELTRQREQYAEELQTQIQQKEAIRAREKASSPRFVAEPHQVRSSKAVTTSSPFADTDLRDNDQAPETHFPTHLKSDSDMQASMAAIAAPLPRPPPPVLTGWPVVSHEQPFSPPATTPFSQPMSEKERFIASMEHGITRSPTHAHRSVTLPAPLYPSTARASAAASTGGMPLARSRTAEAEEAEALRRQQSFKADLEIQIQEKKRQKALELEREKKWEAEQEARLEKEREELRKEFEAEHAARRAKVEADAAENAAAVSRKATANTSKGANEDIQIYAPKRRNITNKPASASSSLPEAPALHENEAESPVPPAQKQRSQKLEENDSPCSTALDSNELSRKLQHHAHKIESKNHIEDQPIPSTTNINNTFTLDAMPGQLSSVSAQTAAALAQQVEELKRLNEALQRDLSPHKTVLELVKDAKLGPSNATLTAAMQQPTQQQQLPIYINPLALGLQTSLIQQPHSSQPAAVLQPMSLQVPHIRSLPIVCTASELRTEDSRPPTRMTTAAVTGKQKSIISTSRLAGSKKSNYVRNSSDSGLIKAVRPVPCSRVSSVGPGPPTAEAATASQKVSRPEVAKESPSANSTTPCLPPLETARLGPDGAAERLGIWKKAKLKLRKLSVAKPTGAKEAVWVVKEESSAAVGAIAVKRTRSLQ